MIKTLAGLAIVGIGWSVSAWLLMIAVSTVHRDWIPALPPLGYIAALLVTVTLSTRTLIAIGIAHFFRDLDGKP